MRGDRDLMPTYPLALHLHLSRRTVLCRRYSTFLPLYCTGTGSTSIERSAAHITCRVYLRSSVSRVVPCCGTVTGHGARCHGGTSLCHATRRDVTAYHRELTLWGWQRQTPSVPDRRAVVALAAGDAPTNCGTVCRMSTAAPADPKSSDYDNFLPEYSASGEDAYKHSSTQWRESAEARLGKCGLLAVAQGGVPPECASLIDYPLHLLPPLNPAAPDAEKKLVERMKLEEHNAKNAAMRQRITFAKWTEIAAGCARRRRRRSCLVSSSRRATCASVRLL